MLADGTRRDASQTSEATVATRRPFSSLLECQRRVLACRQCPVSPVALYDDLPRTWRPQLPPLASLYMCNRSSTV
jgi:hypothetical protein